MFEFRLCYFFPYFFWTKSQAAALPNKVLKKNIFIVGEEFFPYQITVLIFVTEVSVIPGVTLGKAPLFYEALSVLKKKKKRCVK